MVALSSFTVDELEYFGLQHGSLHRICTSGCIHEVIELVGGLGRLSPKLTNRTISCLKHEAGVSLSVFEAIIQLVKQCSSSFCEII